MRKIIALFLAVLTVLSLAVMPVGASDYSELTEAVSAEGNRKGAYSYNGLTYDIINNEAVIMYSPVAGNIVIPDSINGYPVTQIADYAFYECDDIKTVVIGNSVKRVGSYSFWFCEKLTKLTVGSSVRVIGEHAFRYCMLLDDITLPDSIIKLETTAFDDTGYYRAAKNWEDNKSVIYIGKYLLAVKPSYKGALTVKDGTIAISDCALSNCIDITSVSIPGSVVAIGSAAFDNCSSLKRVIIPDSVKYIHSFAFQGCSSLNDITIGKGVERIDSFAFDNTGYYNNNSNWTGGLLYIDSWLIDGKENSLSGSCNIKTGTVGIADWALHNCTGITSVTMPNGLKYVGASAFNNCSKLAKVTIPGSLESIGKSAFIYSKPSDVYINDVAGWCGIYFADIDANPLRKVKNVYVNNTRVTRIELPDTVTSIGQYAFANFTALTEITVPNSVKNIGTDCFYNCNKLKLRCNASSYAYSYAQEHHIATVSLCKHSFELYVSNNDATCTEDGTRTSVCRLGCGMIDTVIDKDSKLGHIFINYTSDNNATCMADGTMTAACSRGCGEKSSITEAGTKRAHVYGEYVYDDNATCMADGTETSSCIYGCGRYMRRIAEGTLTDHRYSNFISNDDYTCTEDGTMTAECDFGCRNSITVPNPGSGGHRFTDWVVTVMPTFDKKGKADRSCSSCSETETRSVDKVSFTDVSDKHWYADAVIYSVAYGYMNGMSDTRFSPGTNITREQFVLILANMAGVDTDGYKLIDSGFEDVKTGQWYSGAVTWAVKEGYVSGMSATRFGRGQSIQRAALARMLYNFASKNGIDVDGRADISAFGDAKELDKAGNAWMKEPIQWAVDAGIISGMSVNGVNCVNPKGTATRAQAARMLMQFDTID